MWICHWIANMTWLRHQMKTFSASLAICAGNSLVPGEFPAQRPVTRSFDVFFDLRLNKRFSKQSWCWWFETLSRPLWRHCNGSYCNSAALDTQTMNSQRYETHLDSLPSAVKNHIHYHDVTLTLSDLTGCHVQLAILSLRSLEKVAGSN